MPVFYIEWISAGRSTNPIIRMGLKLLGEICPQLFTMKEYSKNVIGDKFISK